jgi:hypothetical protein
MIQNYLFYYKYSLKIKLLILINTLYQQEIYIFIRAESRLGKTHYLPIPYLILLTYVSFCLTQVNFFSKFFIMHRN